MRLLRRLAPLALSLLGSLFASEASAHNLGESYIYLQVYRETVTGRFEISFTDLNPALGLAGVGPFLAVVAGAVIALALGPSGRVARLPAPADHEVVAEAAAVVLGASADRAGVARAGRAGGGFVPYSVNVAGAVSGGSVA